MAVVETADIGIDCVRASSWDVSESAGHPRCNLLDTMGWTYSHAMQVKI
jgi:hypothetical protein